MVIQMSVDLRDLKNLQRDLKIIERDFPELDEKVRRRFAERTKQLAKMYVMPRWGETGELKGSIIYRKEGPHSTMVLAGAPYAGYVELGTKPHEIPNNPFWGLIGRKHPGARPMRYMTKAYEQVLKESAGILNEEISQFFGRRKL